MTPEDIAKLPYRPCVGIMLVNGDGHVFTGRRIDSPADAWQMPQGGIDPGEDPRDAALRELFEETGIASEHVRIEAETDDWLAYDVPHELVPRLWGGRYRGQKQKWFLMRLQAPNEVIDIATEIPEFSAWQWLPADQLVDRIVPFKRDLYRVVVAAFESRL